LRRITFQSEATYLQKLDIAEITNLVLISSFRKFYGRYNDLVCDYKLSLTHMLSDLFRTLCYTVVSILALTMDNIPYMYLISTKGARRV
jgi:hypothetical protein